MSAISQKGERLKIDGPTVESRMANLSESFDSVITFAGQSYVEKEVATTFTIEIHSPSDQVLETLHFGYDTEKCICAEYDSI